MASFSDQVKLEHIIYPDSMFVDMFSFENLNEYRKRMIEIGIAVPDDEYIKIDEYNEHSLINKIIHLDKNFIIEYNK